MKKIILFIDRNWLLLTLFLLFAIGLLSLYPLQELDIPKVPGSDKTHHFISYMVLMLPIAISKPRYWVILAFCFISYSAGIEIIQPYVNRSRELLDFMANIMGGGLGILLGSYLAKFKHVM